jgi:cytochrome c peroxidase
MVPLLRRASLALASTILVACGGGGGGSADTGTTAPTPGGTSSSTSVRPSAPAGLVATAGDASIRMSFTPPSQAGDTPVSSYEGSCVANAGAAVTASGTASPLTVVGLTNGVLYVCTVTASNAAGAGTASASASATPSAIAGALTLDLAALANYAAPTLPAYYDRKVLAQDNTPADDAVDDRVATLGRVLFYDKNLSVSGTVACASCHQPAAGFSDPARFSTGFDGTTQGTRHAMRLANVRYYAPGSMFWDKRAASVERQASQPIENPIEMGFDTAHGGMAALLPKLQAIGYYQELFAFAYGDSTVSEPRLQDALAQFERSMVSVGSLWDAGFAQVFDPSLPDQGRSLSVPTLNAQQDRGRALFMGGPGVGVGCAACHEPPSFALVANSLSNGLDAGETTVFKAPSLKNVGTAGAFMHDGRFATLAEVVEHYSSGIQDGPALDARLKRPDGSPRNLNLSAADKAALVAFLLTLTDTALLADPKFATPFRTP